MSAGKVNTIIALILMLYFIKSKIHLFTTDWQDGRVGLRRTVQVNLIPMVHNCLRVSKGAWVQIPLLSYVFVN
ncbi:hypothetical protein N7475_001276 [Penicillium sp. IBT 31633x]|nr:hypothetical protein N7475_001276 [Penicillium sp. IBT 31633x]